MFFWIRTCIHVHVMWCVYICVCMCWNPVNMPGCGRDGGFVAMKLRLDHHLPRRPCTFLHEMGGFTHEWSLQLLPFDEGIYLMCKSFAKGQYLRWLQLSRLVFACRKPSSIFANCQYSPQSFEAVSLHQKLYQNHFSLKTLLNPYWKLWYEAGSDDLRRSEKRWFSGGDGRREIYLCLPEQKDAYGREGTWLREGSRT